MFTCANLIFKIIFFFAVILDSTIQDMTYNWEKTIVISDAFKQLFNNKFLSDLQFTFQDGQKLYAHSIVLSVRSTKFYELILLRNKSNYKENGYIAIFCEKYSYESFRELLKFFYTDRYCINAENVMDLIAIAFEYDIKIMIKECEDFLLTSFTPCKLLNLSIQHGWNYLKNKSIINIAENFDTCVEDIDFLELNKDSIKCILLLDALSNNDEFEIFQHVMKWASQALKIDDTLFHNSNQNVDRLNKNEKRNVLGANLKLIRFSTMTENQFSKCVEMEPNLLTSEECFSIFMTIASKKQYSNEFPYKRRTKLMPENNMCSTNRLVNF